VAGIVGISAGLNAAASDTSWIGGLRGFEHGSDPAFLVTAGLAWLFYAGCQIAKQTLGRGAHNRFGQTLMEDLDRALIAVERQIRNSETVVWWSGVPVFVGMVFTFLVLVRQSSDFSWLDEPLLLILVFVGALLIAGGDVRSKSRSARSEFVPRKRDLESLRTKLQEVEPEES
jgi:hypothetical protein